MRKSGRFYPFLLLLCWTGLVGAGAYAVLGNTMRQYLALRFAKAEATISRCDVIMGSIVRRGLDLEYTFNVKGQAYTGKRYRYDDQNAAIPFTRIAEQHPAGSHTAIYYNPSEPKESIMAPGVNGNDMLLMLFSVPVLIVTAGLWGMIVLKRGIGPEPIGGLRVVEKNGVTRVRLVHFSATKAAFYTLAISSFVAVFPAVLVDGLSVSVRTMQIVWFLVILLTVGAFLGRAFLNWSGATDLKIDQTSQILLVPRTGPSLAIPFKSIESVAVQRRSTNTPSGIVYSYLPAINRISEAGNQDSFRLVDWGWREDKAIAFIEWLGKVLKVPFNDSQSEVLSSGFMNKS